MKNNVIALPVGRIRRNTPVSRRVQNKDPELFVNMIERETDLPQRRAAKRNAYYAAKVQAQEEADRLLFNVGTIAMFSMLTALIGWGLWL